MDKINLACIIDDDPIFVRVVKKMLELTKFAAHICVFANGQEAVDGLTQAPVNECPDIIFLDLNMPTLNGWGF